MKGVRKQDVLKPKETYQKMREGLKIEIINPTMFTRTLTSVSVNP